MRTYHSRWWFFTIGGRCCATGASFLIITSLEIVALVSSEEAAESLVGEQNENARRAKKKNKLIPSWSGTPQIWIWRCARGSTEGWWTIRRPASENECPSTAIKGHQRIFFLCRGVDRGLQDVIFTSSAVIKQIFHTWLTSQFPSWPHHKNHRRDVGTNKISFCFPLVSKTDQCWLRSF